MVSFMTPAPDKIRALRDPAALELRWANEDARQIPYRLIRESCPCAACVDEITGERILDITTIPDDIRPADIKFVGNYSLKITWPDGHDTGLFTWAKLRGLSEIDRDPS